MYRIQLARPALSASIRRIHVSSRLCNAPASDATATKVTETNRAEATKRRFWKTVGVEDRDGNWTVTLDKRPLKTPSGKTLLIPHAKRMTATLIAHEWDKQRTIMQAHSLPMTSLASRALDAFSEESIRAETVEALLRYLDTDTICFHQDYPPQLVDLQIKYWDPLLDWVRQTFDVEVNKSESILFSSQPKATREKLGQVVAQFDPWEMAAFERATYLTKSFITALALVKKHLTVEEAAQVTHVEVNSQIARWGEVEDTHDVDYHDVRKHLGSAACLLSSA